MPFQQGTYEGPTDKAMPSWQNTATLKQVHLQWPNALTNLTKLPGSHRRKPYCVKFITKNFQVSPLEATG